MRCLKEAGSLYAVIGMKKSVCPEIEDSGSGIPKEMNIFESFVTSKPNGWGLGLAIVQQIIGA